LLPDWGSDSGDMATESQGEREDGHMWHHGITVIIEPVVTTGLQKGRPQYQWEIGTNWTSGANRMEWISAYI